MIMYQKSANSIIAVVRLTINVFSNYQDLVLVFTAALSPRIAIHSLLLTQIVIALKGELLLSNATEY